MFGGCHFAPSPDEWTSATVETIDPFDPAYIQVGTFNIDWLTADLPGEFTPRNETDLAMISSLIEAMDIDVLALQEINGVEALEGLQLPEPWSFEVGSTGWSQNLALLYRSDRVIVTNVREVPLPSNNFPSKDPLVADVQALGGTLAFTLVVLHLNPYVEWSEARQRAAQVEDVVEWMTGAGGEAPPALPVIVAGDLNDTLTGLHPDIDALEPMEDVLSFATKDTDLWTNIPFQSQIDHVALDWALEGARDRAGAELGVTVVPHDRTRPWSNYGGGIDDQSNVSSHRPVYVNLALSGRVDGERGSTSPKN